MLAQRRPGPRPRRHLDPSRIPRSLRIAQRRPGPRPRRHMTASPLMLAALDRSTKAGAETPATPFTLTTYYRVCDDAQRRPGPRPRRHDADRAAGEGSDRAQRRPGPRPRRHEPVATEAVDLVVRSTKAGAETPATPLSIGSVRVNSVSRSTKAGAETPATLFGHLGARDLLDRSTKAGAETPATHVAGRDVQPGLIRSTKAGAETPATLLIGAEHLHRRNSVPDLPTPDSDFDHLFGLCLGMDVVTDPQMSSKSATNHNFEPSGA